MRILILVFGALLFSGRTVAAKEPDVLAAFRARCEQYRTHLRLDHAPQVGATLILPLSIYESAQGRFSYLRALETIEKGRARIRKKLKRRNVLKFANDEQQAVFGRDKPGIGVYYRGKIYLTDGNHKAIASHYLGAATMAGYIKRIWDDEATPEEFQHGMENEGYGHWRDADGVMQPMVDLCHLVNDPNLQLARLEIRRVSADFSDGQLTKILRHEGAKRVSAIKINEDISGFEIQYADALTRAGHRWTDTQTVDNLTLEMQLEHLKIVRAAAEINDSPLRKILFLDAPSKAGDLDYKKLIAAHIAVHGCADYLGHGVVD